MNISDVPLTASAMLDNTSSTPGTLLFLGSETANRTFYDVVIIGGNSGFEERLFLTKFATRVDIVEFSSQAKARKILQDKVAEKENMSVTLNHAVKELRAKNGKLDAVSRKIAPRASARNGNTTTYSCSSASLPTANSPRARQMLTNGARSSPTRR